MSDLTGETTTTHSELISNLFQPADRPHGVRSFKPCSSVPHLSSFRMWPLPFPGYLPVPDYSQTISFLTCILKFPRARFLPLPPPNQEQTTRNKCSPNWMAFWTARAQIWKRTSFRCGPSIARVTPASAKSAPLCLVLPPSPSLLAFLDFGLLTDTSPTWRYARQLLS